MTGGIACYKAVALARLLAQAGARVDVVLTRSASEFIGEVTFEGVTGRPVHSALVAAGHGLDHIRLARGADLVVVAPATADFCARAGQGRSDDLLGAVLLATKAPVLIVPAMNDRMWAHPQSAVHAERLREIGYTVLDPDTGALAAGEGEGPGRMPEPPAILAQGARMLAPDGALIGRRVLVTAGPTQEPLDPVRFISNRSSGRMGIALAEAAWQRGAEVVLVAGPVSVALPVGPRIVHVETTAEMHSAVAEHLPDSDVLIMAAAPADYRVATPAAQKLKKTGAPPSLLLETTPDILKSTRENRRAGAVIVGFALETERLEENARAKLETKGLDLIVANSAIQSGAGFGTTTNRVSMYSSREEPQHLPLMPKEEVAHAILDRVETLLGGR